MHQVQSCGRMCPPSVASRRFIVVCALGLSMSPASAQSLKDAAEAAWARSPQGQSAEARLQEAQSKRSAADRWFAEPPSLSFGQRSDRLARHRGMREDEVELALPLPAWNARSADQVIAAAESDQIAVELRHAKWRIAGEVRERYWHAHLAEIEMRLAAQRVVALTALADDVARRLAAGELARLDQHRAEAERDAASIALADTEWKAQQARQAFRQITGLAIGPAAMGEVDQSRETSRAPVRVRAPIENHVAYHALTSRVALAVARSSQARNVSRDPLELTLTSTRERADIGEAFKSSTRIGIRIPLATASRNQPRIAETTAARIEAETELTLAREQISTDIDLASNAVARWMALQPIAERRAASVRDAARLVDTSFRLGESDLPTRLRAESERLDAERAAERARAELARAISLLNQALGLLP